MPSANDINRFWLRTCALALCTASAVPDVAYSQSCTVLASGQLLANGCTTTVPGGTYATTAQATPVFLGQNGGSITATGPVAITSAADLSYGVSVQTGSSVVLNGGSVTTNGAGGNKGTPTLRANGGGSSITATGVALTTNGGGSYAAIAENNGSITLHGGTVDTFNTSVHSAGLNTVGSGTTVGGGATITADQGLIIRATDVGAYAQGGTINLDTVTITERAVSAGNTSGLRADTNAALATPPGLINANNVNISMSGNASVGVLAVGGGKVVLTNSTVTTSGSARAGLSAAQIAPTFPGILPEIDATNVTVNTSGLVGHGAYAYNGAIINLNKVQIQTTGSTAYGLFSEGYLLSGPSILTRVVGTGVTVNTSGDSAFGAVAQESGLLDLTDSSVSATGANAGGVFVGDTGSVATLLRSPVSSAQYDAARVGDSGHLFVSDSALTGQRHGVSSTGGTAADPNVISVSGGSIKAATGDAFNAQDTIVQIVLKNGTALSTGSGNLLNVISSNPASLATNASFTTQNITATGNIIADPASVATIGITSGSAITGIQLNTITAVDGTSTWIMNGNSDIHALTLAGQALFTPPAGLSQTAAYRVPAAADPTVLTSYKTLTTTNYTGAGGVIGLNTYLMGDNAPSDRLIINGGTATGTSGLHITNTGGAGALTTANGILVVDTKNGGITAPGAFALNGRAVAGAFEYRLFRGSLNASNPDAWYLRSEQAPTPPTPPAPPAPPDPLYRPEVAAYLANQRLAGQMFVHSLHDRLGEPQYVEEQGFNRADDKPRSGWLRVVGKWEGSHSADGVFKTSTDSFLLHGGAELAKWKLFRDDGADRGHLGVMGSYGYASTDANARGNPFSAKGKVEGWSVGAYGTWYQNDEQKLGAYVDTWFQYGWFTNRVEGQELPTVRYNAQGFALSGETGYAMITRSDWVVEPQGQLIYVGYSEGDIAEPNGTRVSGADSHGWISRLGVRLHRTYVREEGKSTWQPYLTLNWWHTGVSSNITFNELPLGSLYPSNRYEVKIGTNTQFSKRWTRWANVAGAWGAQSFYQYAVRVGAKYTW